MLWRRSMNKDGKENNPDIEKHTNRCGVFTSSNYSSQLLKVKY